MNFIIRQNATLPLLKFDLSETLLRKYDITDEMLESAAFTFSMMETDTGIFRIANKKAELRQYDSYENMDDIKYELIYKFEKRDTKKQGVYAGEFVIDFFDQDCGKLKLPTDSHIQIIIKSTITETSIL